jgi:site-specific DNA-methyltransferase (adenine-specific)
MGNTDYEAIRSRRQGTAGPRDHSPRSPSQPPAPPPPPPPAPPRWEIVQGDCIAELAKVERGIVRLAFADPPYNLGVDYGKHQNDNMPREEYLEWCFRWIRATTDVLTDDGSLWLLSSHEHVAIFELMLIYSGLHIKN